MWSSPLFCLAGALLLLAPPPSLCGQSALGVVRGRAVGGDAHPLPHVSAQPVGTTDRPLLLLVPMLIFPVWGLLASPVAAQEADSLILEGKRLLQQGFDQGNLEPLHRARALFAHATDEQEHAALAHYYRWPDAVSNRQPRAGR